LFFKVATVFGPLVLKGTIVNVLFSLIAVNDFAIETDFPGSVVIAFHPGSRIIGSHCDPKRVLGARTSLTFGAQFVRTCDITNVSGHIHAVAVATPIGIFFTVAPLSDVIEFSVCCYFVQVSM
jgi:hypothetical protein